MSLSRKSNTDRTEPSALPLLITSLALAVVLLLLVALLTALIPGEAGRWPVMAVGVYFVVLIPFLLVYFIRHRKAVQLKKELFLNNPSLTDTIQTVSDLPYFLLDPADNGSVKMMSNALRRMIDVKGWTHNFPLSDLTVVSAKHIFASAVCSRPDMKDAFSPDYARIFPEDKNPSDELSKEKSADTPFARALSAAGVDPDMGIEIGDRKFLMHATPLRAHGRTYCLVWLDDMTDYVLLWAKDEREYPVIAYILLDNLEELAQYVGVNTRTASNKIEELLNRWATKMDGLIREYDNDRYLLIFPQEKLKECIADGFSILEEVKSVELGDKSIPPTISIGAASTQGSLKDRHRDASSALDMALQRGGDQVAVKTPEGTLYFGGRSKSMERDISRDLRVTSAVLCNLISESDNILIAGHKNPDYDAIASCIGVARLALCVKGSPSNIHIVSDLKNREFNQFREMLTSYHEYDNMFISADAALDQIRTNTLLIICDVNNVKIIEGSDLIPSATSIAIIDHHTRQAEFDFKPVIEMIQPQASSASELVACMLMQSPYYDKLTKEEATLLLAGIMLDTKNFVNSTGWQTFEAAQYLYTRNAHTDRAHTFFRESLSDMVTASEFGRVVRIYRNCIGITYISLARPLDSGDKISASKAADKLLTVEGIRASFAIVCTETGTIISGRSSDPTINVGSILRELGGGGHFDSAGTQLSKTTVGKAAEQLRTAIDHYMDALKK